MEKTKLKFLLVCALALFFSMNAALADWFLGDDFKMHYPQMSDPFGWDVAFRQSLAPQGPRLELADDCRSVSVKWTSKEMDVHHGGVVELDGYIYGSNFNTVVSGNWICLDWNTGQVMYEDDRYNKGQVIALGNRLICYEERKQFLFHDSDV